MYLQGLAADLAVSDADEHTVLATDSLKYFSQAFQFRPIPLFQGTERLCLVAGAAAAGNRAASAEAQNEQGSAGGRRTDS